MGGGGKLSCGKLINDYITLDLHPDLIYDDEMSMAEQGAKI